MRLNVINRRGNRSCLLCGADNDLHRVSLQCKVSIFVQGNIYVPENVRVCDHHLNRNGELIPELIPSLRQTNRPYCVPRLQ